MQSYKKAIIFSLLCVSLVSNIPAWAQSRNQKNKKKKPETTQESTPTKVQPTRQEPSERSALDDIQLKDNTTAFFGDTKFGYQPVVEKIGSGEANYTTQTIKATGMSVLDTDRFKNRAQARAMAIQGARADAQRKLLETTQGVHVIGETTVSNMITESDIVKTRVEGLLKGAVMVGEPIEKDGAMEVTMQINMYGDGSLANALHEELQSKDYASRNIEAKLPPPSETSVAMVAPVSEPLEDIAPNPKKDKPLAFLLNGKALDPAMFPLIMDEKGNLLVDMSKMYDPKKGGKFPRIMQAGKEIMGAAGFQKGVEVVEVIEASGGKLTVDTSKSKVNWKQIGNTLAKIGKFLLLLL
jgi:hypothetical protein